MSRDTNTNDILDSLVFIKDHMLTKDEGATKDDVRALDRRFDSLETQLAHIKAELRDIRTRLESLEQQLASHAGYAKEIDHALERIARIEKHLGLEPKAAA